MFYDYPESRSGGVNSVTFIGSPHCLQRKGGRGLAGVSAGANPLIDAAECI